jgi:hypothetical protein
MHREMSLRAILTTEASRKTQLNAEPTAKKPSRTRKNHRSASEKSVRQEHSGRDNAAQASAEDRRDAVAAYMRSES